MLIQQAIFTSLKTRTQEGYQLAATSDGVTRELAETLAAWGPAHDSLLDRRLGASSINFHPLADDLFCISRTVAEGNEYSGRSGPRVYTQMLVVPDSALARFANNPFAIVEALSVGGQMIVHDKPPAQLEPIRLLGRASLINPLRLEELAVDAGADALANLIELATRSPRLAIRSQIPLERLLACLLMLLPPSQRLAMSFSTGLRWSPRRPFRLIALPSKFDEQRDLERSAEATLLDLTKPGATAPEPVDGWPIIVRDVLRSHLYTLLPDLLRQADALEPRL